MVSELEFCLDFWKKQGKCEYGGSTMCEQCAVPYVIWKITTGEELRGKMERMTLEEWQQKLQAIRTTSNFSRDFI